MSKKTLKANSINSTHGNIEFGQGNSGIPEIVEMIANDENNAKSEQIYLRDTLVQILTRRVHSRFIMAK